MDSSDGEDYVYQRSDGEEGEEEEEYSYSDGDDEPPVIMRQASMSTDGYKIIDSDELRATMMALVEDISSVLAIHPYAAAALLRHNSWNKEAVIDSFCTDPDKAKEAAGIARFILEFHKGKQSKICAICRDEVAARQLIAIGCGHLFCRPCFTAYLVSKIDEGVGCPLTRCPEFRCTEVVTENFFRALVPAEKLATYQRYNLKSFVDMSSAFRWCPGRGCDYVAMGSAAQRSILCRCGVLFCFKCGEEAHVPASCDDMVTWIEKCRNESETANWILANTRKCPKCMTRIEKNQGCNHMTCRQCKFEFCWICMGPWTEHGANTGGYYKCNKYDPTLPTKDEQDGAKAKAELDRYLHYYKRYDNHNKAQQYAEKQEEEIERRMMRLQETDGSRWIDVQFLKAANEKLVECRRVLKYTYVFGYYLQEGTARKRLFEHHQENLEKFTEHLSWLSEQNLEEFKKEEKRSEVVNYTRVTETFLKNLLKSVEDGLGEEDDMAAAGAGGADAKMAVSSGGGGGASSSAGGGAAASSNGAIEA